MRIDSASVERAAPLSTFAKKRRRKRGKSFDWKSGARRFFFRETSLIAECEHRFFDASYSRLSGLTGERRNKRAINCILVEPGKPGIRVFNI